MDQVDDGADAELAHDGSAVSLDSLYADGENGGNLFIASRLGQELYDFTLARRQDSRVAIAGRELAEPEETFQHALRDFGGKERLVPGHGFDGSQELRGHVGLQHVSARPRGEKIADKFLALIHGKNQYFCFRNFLADLSRGFHTVELRHAEVENCEIRLEFHGQGDSFAAVLGLSADLPIRSCCQQSDQAAADHFVIVSQQDPNHAATSGRRGSWSGTIAATIVPGLARLISKLPPISRKRSAIPARPPPPHQNGPGPALRGRPLPRSRTSRTTLSASFRSVTVALALCECFWILLSASCTTRNRTFSTRGGMRLACDGMTRLMWMGLRLQNPSMYEHRAALNSWPSCSGGR